MSDLLDIAEPARPGADPQAFDGIIAADAEDLTVRVIIPEFSPDLTFGPALWMPFVTPIGIFLPKRGDKALVIRTGVDSVWIPAWTPSSFDTPDYSF